MTDDPRGRPAQERHPAPPGPPDLGEGPAEFSWERSEASDDGFEPPPPQPRGRRLGRYELRGLLGRGGMGVVYRAYDPELRREVAVKILRAGDQADPLQTERFLREARAVARLAHPHIVPVLDIGSAPEGLFFTLDLIEGPSLAQRLTGGGPLPLAEALGVAAQVARALHHAHEAGLVHRDVKPSNILLDPTQGAKLTDFGVAAEAEASRLTATQQLLGTPTYMAPEQADCRWEEVGPRSDVYGLGSVLYEALIGAPPFVGPSAVAVLQKILDPAEAPSFRALPLPDPVRRVLARAMAWDPQDRYPSALELAVDLEACLHHDPVHIPAASLPRQLTWALRRHRRGVGLASLLAVALLLAVLASAAATRLQAEARRRAQEAEAQARLTQVMGKVKTLDLRGEEAAGDAQLEGFARLPDHLHTDAAAQAWLTLGERQLGRLSSEQIVPLFNRGQDTPGLISLAQAYTAAHDQDLQARILLRLATALRDIGDDQGLGVALDRLEALDPSALATPEGRRLSLDLRLGYRDLAGARALLEEGDPRRPLLDALSRAIALPFEGEVVGCYDVDGDGRLELVVWTADQRLQIRALTAPDFPVLQEMPEAERPLPGPTVPGMGPLFLEQGWGDPTTAQLRIHELTPQGMVERFRWPDAGVGPLAASGDLDGDGIPEHYVGTKVGSRHLVEVHPPAGGLPWRVTSPHPPSDAVASDIQALKIGDLDGDGRLELVVAYGPWRAYDLRIYQRDRGAPTLRLVARTQLGFVSELALMARRDRPGADLIAAVYPLFPSRVAFPQGDPTGAPGGLYTFRWEGGALERIGALDLHPPADRPADLVQGDWDGDGDDDLLIASPAGSSARAGLDGGISEPLRLLGIQPTRVHADVDGDGDEEIFALHDGRPLLLGAGEAPLPPRVFYIPLPRRALDIPTDAAWEAQRVARAQDLLSMGLASAAAQVLTEGADLALTAPTRQAMLVEAGALLEALTRWGDAGERFRAARQTPGPRAADALLGEARSHLARQAFAEAREVIDAAEALGGLGPEREAELARDRERLRAHADTPTLDLDLGGPLDPAWEVTSAWGLRRGGGALTVRGWSELGAVARLPLTWHGGAVGLTVAGALEAASWSAGLKVRLVPEGAAPDAQGAARGMELKVMLKGGGRLYAPGLWYDDGFHQVDAGVGLAASEDPLAAPLPFLLQASLDIEGRRCYGAMIAGESHGEWETGVPAALAVEGHERWWLELESTGDAPASLRARLTTLRLTGFSIRRDGQAPPSAASALADLSPLEALARLDRLPVEAGGEAGARVARVLALDELGRASVTGALAELLEADPGAPLPPDLRAALAADPARWLPRLRAAGREEALGDLADVWSVILDAHPHDPRVQSTLTGVLGELDDPQPPSGEVDVDAARLALTLARAEAWCALRRPRLAQAPLLRAEALAAALLEEGIPPEALARPVTEAKILDARVKASLGEVDRAFASLAEALDTSPVPELIADRLPAWEELAPLQADPRWEGLVVRAQRLGR